LEVLEMSQQVKGVHWTGGMVSKLPAGVLWFCGGALSPLYNTPGPQPPI
jgi:hypothetical protein